MFFNIIIAILLQLVLVSYVFNSRGYFAVGGEFLVIPLIIMLVWVKNTVKECLKNERDFRIGED